MRTATPFVTCSRMTEFGPSATRGEISMPRFMGPGCMMSTSGLARPSRRAFTRFEDYSAAYLAGKPERRERPWIGVYFSRDTATSGQTELPSAINAALDARGFNALFGFGYPADAALPVYGISCQ